MSGHPEHTNSHKEPTQAPKRRNRWLPRWQVFTRAILVFGLATFAMVVFSAISERRAPVVSSRLQRGDPDAVMESRGSELVQSASGADNFLLEASRQLTYSDGSVRFIGGVKLTVPEQPERESFVVTGNEASVNETQSDFEVTGNVRFETVGGLSASTGSAHFTNEQNFIVMHDDAGPTTVTQAGLEASGREVMYDRERKLIRLQDDATVRLLPDADRASVEILSKRAVLAQVDRYMLFEDGAVINTGEMVLQADEATAYFGEEETALERLELRGRANVRSYNGTLREMRADEATLLFEQTTRQPEGTTLVGHARIELAGHDAEQGSRIDASTMNIELTPSGRDVMALDAAGGVTLRLPKLGENPEQHIRAAVLTGTGTPQIGLTTLRFDHDVEYLESLQDPRSESSQVRLVKAERLEAGVEPGLSALPLAAFHGNVRFEDETRRAEAQKIEYDVISGTISLENLSQNDEPIEALNTPPDGVVPMETAGVLPVDGNRLPRLIDATNTIEATTMTISLDGATITASGNLQSVLTPNRGTPLQGNNEEIPALLDRTARVNVSAESLNYDGATGVATYDGDARLWQGPISFVGSSLTVNKQTGGLTVIGDATTTIQLIRLNKTTQENEISRTEAEANSFVYDNINRYALYDGEAVLRSESGDLKADTISVHLEPDGTTLDRMEAIGSVMLRLDGRWATGESLVYFEASGRYEMEGEPVEIVEEVESEESEPIQPTRQNSLAEPTGCRTTSGKTLTFYRSTDTVAVDGREQLRTESRTHPCSPLTF